MRNGKQILCLVLVFFISLGFAGVAEPKKKDKVVGTIWSYRATKMEEDMKKAEEISGHFRVVNHRVFSGPKRVGAVKPIRDLESEITITDWPEMNGTMTVQRTGKKPITWKGKFIKSDGSNWSITLKVAQK